MPTFDPAEFARIVSPDEAETCDFVVCAPDPGRLVAGLRIDHRGSCADCSAAFVWTDAAPKIPPKVCIDGAERRAA